MKTLMLFFLLSFTLLAQVERTVNLGYGTIFYENGSITYDLVANEWQHITNETHDLFSASCEKKCLVKNDSLFVRNTGLYDVTITVVYSGKKHAFYEITFEHNGILHGQNTWRNQPAMNDEIYTSTSKYTCKFNKGDIVRAMVRNATNDSDITITSIVIIFNKKDI